MIFWKNKKKAIREIEDPLMNIEETDKVENKEENKHNNMLVWGVMLFFFGILFSRVTYLQLQQTDYYRKLSDNNRIQSIIIRAPRGIIKDRFGEVLAHNIAGFELFIVPANLPQEQEKKRMIFDKLKKITSLEDDKADLILKASAKDKKHYSLKEKITTEEALQLIEQIGELPGIYVSQSAQREYPQGESFAHIIGYEGKITQAELKKRKKYLLIDHLGKSGLELIYEKELHGQHGRRRFEVDAKGEVERELEKVQPLVGDELILNIDARLQNKVFDILKNSLAKNKEATGATVIIVDPRGGQIRALVSLPSFDNNLFVGGIKQEDYQRLISDENKPLLNRAISGEYPPGSVFKLVIAGAALEERVIQENTSVNCSGSITVGKWTFPDWKAHGVTDVKKAIAESCDVFFYALGGGYGNINGLGANRIKQYAELFGYGEKSGIDLSGEVKGNIPDKSWKFKQIGERWYLGDDYHMAIGQGFVLVTPLQVAMATSAIANGGTLFVPRIVDKIINPYTHQEKNISAEEKNKILIGKDNLKIVRVGMRQTVEGEKGSARSLNSLKVAVAGKTGTAQFGSEDKTHSWFTSFAPYEQPELAMVVLVEGGGEGHLWAVPITKEIYQWYFDWQRGDKNPHKEDNLENKVD